MTTISIIGSSGRGEDAKFMTKIRFENVVQLIEDILIKTGYKWDQITLQSGGAAFIDHVAVVLAIKHGCKLNLCLPCEWVNHQYIDTGISDWRTNPGKLANMAHYEFSKIMGVNTLLQIEEAKPRFCVYKGFHARNRHVAKCDIMIALTSSIGKEPEHGGTFHTWGLCKAYKAHISLGLING